jgi:hypothetical protein
MTVEQRLEQLEKRNKRLPAALTVMAWLFVPHFSDDCARALESSETICFCLLF